MEQLSSWLPVLPIRNNVVFPSTTIPLIIGRKLSLAAVDHALSTDSMVIVIAQRQPTEQDPSPEDLCRVGTLCKVESSTDSEFGSRQVVVTGISRFEVARFQRSTPQGYLTAQGQVLSDYPGKDSVQDQALFLNLKELSKDILDLLPGASLPLVRLMDRIEDPSYLTNICSAYLNLDFPQKQQILETVSIPERMDFLLKLMRQEREVLSLQKEIRDKMSERLSKAQREALLREQIRTIQTELGDQCIEEATDLLEKQLKGAELPDDARLQADGELKRLKNLPSNSAEYHVIRTYLEWLAALPWTIKSEERIDLEYARKILDDEHYGLSTVKHRILQFLAVAKLKNDLRGPILCLVGPPGTGKTSLGSSIARALGRKFIRTSLGGVRDEAEIRGHRRTYVGAMPGRIIQSLKRCGTRNPVMILDEIDKLGADFHGDPSSAMLEVLDPEQNWSFTDHYIDTPFNLSDVFFICTANIVDTIPGPLRDRMEIIEVNGYTHFEKLHIAQDHLIPKLLKEHGIQREWIEIPTSVIENLINQRTREAGVRELQRQLAALLRSVAEKIVTGQAKPVQISLERVTEWLGPEKFFPESAEAHTSSGVALGLAWTPHGGDILYIETTTLEHGSGRLILTGQLGEVMKESAQIALSLVRSALATRIPAEYAFETRDIHIHLPAGAIPKDGPSAGLTLVAALVSLLTKRPLPGKLAMTGEITLRGAILPVGGIQEKVLAAHRAGVKTILMPKLNQADLQEIPPEVKNAIQFEFVQTVDEFISKLGIFASPQKVAA